MKVFGVAMRLSLSLFFLMGESRALNQNWNKYAEVRQMNVATPVIFYGSIRTVQTGQTK